MGHKIFASYKYADASVYNITDSVSGSTVRDYVDKFESLIDKSDHIYKGESDDDDLSQLSDDTIWAKLRNRIYDSTLTIVFISPSMKTYLPDKDQWIPWEVSYSLKETSRKDSGGNAVTSKTNAMLGVVLPDIANSYDYYFHKNTCCDSGCIINQTGKLFNIMSKNMFNYNGGNTRVCRTGSTIWTGKHSYITTIKWDAFVSDMQTYIDNAYDVQEDIDNYSIYKEI